MCQKRRRKPSVLSRPRFHACSLQALKEGKKIIVCTIQTFPFALKTVQALSATEGKRFAVIADEAHSSQTGEAAAKLKQLLSAEEWAAWQDGGEIDTETLLAWQMSAKASQDKGLTYIAFTATPKQKTLELFGRKDAEGLPQPFHVYSMRQAIEEGFILDVLRRMAQRARQPNPLAGGEQAFVAEAAGFTEDFAWWLADAQRIGEGQPNLRVRLNLGDRRQLKLHRVFYRDDFFQAVIGRR